MKRLISKYLNEAVSLAVLLLMVVALVHTESRNSAINHDAADEAALTSIAMERSR